MGNIIRYDKPTPMSELRIKFDEGFKPDCKFDNFRCPECKIAMGNLLYVNIQKETLFPGIKDFDVIGHVIPVHPERKTCHLSGKRIGLSNIMLRDLIKGIPSFLCENHEPLWMSELKYVEKISGPGMMYDRYNYEWKFSQAKYEEYLISKMRYIAIEAFKIQHEIDELESGGVEPSVIITKSSYRKIDNELHIKIEYKYEPECGLSDNIYHPDTTTHVDVFTFDGEIIKKNDDFIFKKAMLDESTNKQKRFFEKYSKFFPDSYSVFKERLM